MKRRKTKTKQNTGYTPFTRAENDFWDCRTAIKNLTVQY